MTTEIKAPNFPESVAEGTIATWHKQPGEQCERDELIVDIETDKVVLEVVAPADGVISEIIKGEGDTVESGEVIGQFAEGESGSAGGEKTAESTDTGTQAETSPQSEAPQQSGQGGESESGAPAGDEPLMSPAAKKLAEEKGIDPARIEATGRDGRLLKEDVLRHVDQAARALPSHNPSPGLSPKARRRGPRRPGPLRRRRCRAGTGRKNAFR